MAIHLSSDVGKRPFGPMPTYVFRYCQVESELTG